MEHQSWMAVYEVICEAFGFDPAADRNAAARLRAMLTGSPIDRLDFSADHVAVVVGADLDATTFRTLRDVDRVVATGDALGPLETAGRVPSLVVTDLDSDPARVCARTRCTGLVAVHAHGDNHTAIDSWIPRMDRHHVIGTTQTEPDPPLVNLGGFTDGDRAAYIAHGLDARQLSLVGWNLGDRSVSAMKRKKLDWAARLLTHLEQVRGETYSALDGHRDPLTSHVPALADRSTGR